MLERWTRAVIRHRLVITAGWLILIILGLIAASNLSPHLTTSLSVPGSESAKADEILSRHFQENIEGTFTVVFKFKSASKNEIEGLRAKISTAAKTIPSAAVTIDKALGGILYTNIGTSFKLTEAASYTDALRHALAEQGLQNAQVTGPPAIYRDVTPVLASDLHRGQGVAILLALLLLFLVLGACWAITVPFIFAAASISLTLGVVYLLAQKFLMVLYIPNIVELIGFGLAIDYSLLIVHRFRRELLEDDETTEDNAIVKTMQTAGRTVVLSGVSVAIGLAMLLLVPVPFVRSLGAAGLLVPIASILATLTLQPALLSYLGKGGVQPKGFSGFLAKRDLLNGTFARIARFVIRRPVSVLLSSLAILGILASFLFWLQTTPSSLTAIPVELESARALSIVESNMGSGIITPTEIVFDLGAPGKATLERVVDARMSLAQKILKDSEVFGVATGEKAPFVDPSGRYLRMFVVGRHDLGAEASQKLVSDLRKTYIPQTDFPEGTRIYLGGIPAQGADLLERIFTSFPWIVLLILIFVYLVLLRAFRSIILPLKAILMDLISIAAAYGSLVLVFRFGVGSSILGTYRLDQIEAWVLIFLFAALFGLSMDYEVFIVSRMREARSRGASNSEAIIEGMAHTGGVVTAAAIILVGALSGLVFGHFAGLQQLGIGLALGVLVDATIIRGLLLPSAMVLLGRWNWWLPSSVAKLARTKASPLREREARL
ncbi:MAG: MMPL family transporter [Candidatus Nanopelagicaceae bacterium]|nr:MMPL family transporter [Candidatus Nanopelagicaceae bacterium]